VRDSHLQQWKEAVVSVTAGSRITASFGEDGRLTRNAGCNDYFVTFETKGALIEIGPAPRPVSFAPIRQV
jgi:heat shock protein HslJ